MRKEEDLLAHAGASLAEGEWQDIIAAFAVTAQPIPYQSLDDKPVRLVFLLVGTDNLVGPHIKLLSRISRLMNKEEFRNKLLETKSAQDIVATFKQEEANYSEM